MGLPRASRGSAMHVFLVIWAQEAPLLWLFTCKKEVLIVLHLKKIKLAVNETKLSTLLARTRALVLYISISGPKSYRDFRETGPWPRQGTASHVAVKSGQIPLRTSQRMEENDSKGSKDRVFVLRFVDFDPFYFCFFIVLLWLWRQGFEFILKRIVQYSQSFLFVK